MSPRRVSQLLKRFGLSPQASESDLKQAYLKQAKILHPDVAGKSSEDQFRRLKAEYEEAMEFLRDGDSKSDSKDSETAYERAQRQYHEGGRAPPRYPRHGQQQEAAKSQPFEQTPAQRLRNVLLTAIGVIGVTIFMWRQFSQSRLSSKDSAAPQPKPEAYRELPTVAEPDEPSVSNYYKTRTSRSTVRKRSGEARTTKDEITQKRGTNIIEGVGLPLEVIHRELIQDTLRAKKEAKTEEPFY